MKRFKLFSALFLTGFIIYLCIGLYTMNPHTLSGLKLRQQGYMPFYVALAPDRGVDQDKHEMGMNQDAVFAGEVFCLIGGSNSGNGLTEIYVKPDENHKEEAEKASRKAEIIYLAFNLLSGVWSIILFVLILRLIAGFIQEQVFSRTQSRRLTWIAVLLLLADVMRICDSLILYQHASQHLHLEGWHVVLPEIDLGGIVVASVLFLFNELLRSATQLEKENDLTI